MSIYKIFWILLLIGTTLTYIIGTAAMGSMSYTVYGYKSVATETAEKPTPAVATQKVLGSPDWTEAELSSKYFESKKPILINEKNPVPYMHEPDLKKWADNIFLESKTHEAFSDMWRAALADGESLWIISAYRSDERQFEKFSDRMNMYKDSGLTEEEAYNETVKTIASVGHSEHALGMAIDLNLTSTDFETHTAFNWLQKNAAKYGFVLRYPKGKESVTGHSYEPWHYRYVGSNHATRILEMGLTLEEYLLDENYYR